MDKFLIKKYNEITKLKEVTPMSKYAGTQTEKNLMAAFSGESEARNKYTYFASKAKKEGYEQIAALFLKTADNEKEHANYGSKNWKASAIQQKTLFLPQQAKTTNGPICTQVLQKLLKKKVSLS